MLVITNSFNTGGAEKMLLNYLNIFKEHDKNITIVSTHYSQGEFCKELTDVANCINLYEKIKP